MRLFFLFHGLILFSLSSNAEKLFNFDDHSLYDFNQIEYGQNQATGAIVDSVNGNLYGAVKSYDGLEFGRIIEGPTPYWTQGSFRTVLDCRGPLGMFLTPASGPIGLPSQRTGLWGTVYAASQASSASYASDVAIKLPEPARSISISVIKQARWEYTSEPDWTAESPLTTRIVTWEPLPQPELKIFALSASGTVLDVVNNIPKSDHVYSSACSSYYSNSRSMIADDYSGMAPITLTSNSSEAIAYVAVRAIDAIGQTTGSYGYFPQDPNVVNVVFDDFKYVPFTQEVDCDVADKGRMVPHHSQVDPRWSAVKYDHTDGSLGSLGCALSSLSMILSSYGLRTDNLGAPLTPMTLNTGLSNLSSPINGELLGFTKTGGILWQGAVLYGRQAFTNQCLRDGGEAPTCIQEGINSLAFKGIKRGSDYSYEMVRREICNGNPVMLEVPSRSAPQDLSKSHFVVASAAVTIDGVRTFKIKDPATLAQPNRDVLLSTEYGNTVRGVRLFSPTRDPSMIFIYATPNVEFVVTDPLGQKTGRNSITDESYSNIPGAVYTVEPGIADLERVGGVDRSTQPQLVFQNIEAPVEGQYDIKVYGKGGGAYELAIYGFDSDGYQNNFTRSTGVLGQGEVKTISFGQSELPYVPPVSQINADLKNVRIKTIEVTLPKKKKMEKLSITGQISQKNKKTFSVLFKKKIKLHIGEFKLELSRNDFRWIGIGSLGIYTHTDFNRNLSVILTSTGTVSVTSTQGSSFNAGSFDVLRIELDDLIAEKSITVKCKNKICTGK